MTIFDLAGQAYDAFETAKRGEGDDATDFTRLKDEHRGTWLQDLCHHAHGDMFPDDWKYETIRAALGHIHDNDVDEDDGDGAHEFADSQVDVYTAARLEWLASNLTRSAYVDEARDEGLIGPNTDTIDAIGIGQYQEAREVYGLVYEKLRERFEEIDALDEDRQTV